MQICKFLAPFSFVFLGISVTGVRAGQPDVPNPVLTGADKASPEAVSAVKPNDGKASGAKFVLAPKKDEQGKEIESTVKPNDNNKTSKAEPAPVVEDRKPGTITVKPLAINFSSLTFGMRKKSQLINGYPLDIYRSSFPYLSNRGEAVGSSYDLELGVMVTSQIEAFTILGFSYERPFNNVVVAMSPVTYDNLAFNFKSRTGFEVSLGGRYYWNTEKPWFPFVALIGTVTFQNAIKANVFGIQPYVINPIYTPLGSLTLQGRKTLLGGTLQVGADYQFNKLVSLTLSAGLRYTQRSGLTYTSITSPVVVFGTNNTKQISCRDNRSMWSVPVMAALKLTF